MTTTTSKTTGAIGPWTENIRAMDQALGERNATAVGWVSGVGAAKAASVMCCER